jgi:metal-sulfur cluster biosynthetic enzyme
VVDRTEIVNALHTVEDPELGMDIVELGLFYDVEIDGPKVKVIHTLTSMGCPAGPMIQEDIHNATASVEGVGEVEVELTFDPPWTPDKMSDDASVSPTLESAERTHSGIVSTILPSCSPRSRRSCAARASARGYVESMCTRARPVRTSS